MAGIKYKRIIGAGKPPETRGRKPGGPVIDLLLSMQVGDCYDVDRPRASIDHLAMRLRRLYDMERRFAARPAGRPGWTRVWRVL